jgi:hypothetical protein
MNKIVKIFGLHNSGTNVLNLLLRLNFDNFICLKELGWKHQTIKDFDYFLKLEKLTNAEICLVFCVRDPYDWCYRFIKNSYEYEIKSVSAPLFIKWSNQEYYESVVEMYNQKLKNYLEILNVYKDKSTFVKYEDLIDNQSNTLEDLYKKLNLSKSLVNKDFIILNKKISSEMQITNEKISKYRSYKNLLSNDEIEFINKNLDLKTLNYFNYTI